MANEYFQSEARQLPVFLLLDASGSMFGEKIKVLNNAVKTMLYNFKDSASQVVNISVAIIVFKDMEASVLLDLQSAEMAYQNFHDLEANGCTPMGDAFRKAKEILENKNIVPSRSYRPTVVLVSDGEPNDNWQSALDAFVNSGRSSKCSRMAMGIGEAAERGTNGFKVLADFVKDDELVFTANNADRIYKFFKFVTMSTVSRVQSSNPNLVSQINPNVAYEADDDDDEDIF